MRLAKTAVISGTPWRQLDPASAVGWYGPPRYGWLSFRPSPEVYLHLLNGYLDPWLVGWTAEDTGRRHSGIWIPGREYWVGGPYAAEDLPAKWISQWLEGNGIPAEWLTYRPEIPAEALSPADFIGRL